MALLSPWIFMLSLARHCSPVLAASDLSSSVLSIPETIPGPSTATISQPSESSIVNVRERIVGDDYDDSDMTGPQLCRNPKHDAALTYVANSRCPLPFDSLEIKRTAAPSSAPWTHLPACSDRSSRVAYCVFTHADYGGGLSIVARPETASALASILGRAAMSAPAAANGHQNNTDPLVGVHDVPGKGLGVIAHKPIQRGTVLLRDHARILADIQFPLHVRRADGQRLLHKAASRLPTPADVRDLSRSVEAKLGEPLGVVEENILSTNSFAVSVQGIAFMALFPKVARINHACKPTAITRFNDRDLTQQVIAFRDIEPGEEITISYTDFGLTHDERHERLHRRWGFTCSCDLCNSSSDAIQASDTRRRRVNVLRNELVSHLQRGAFSAAIRAYEDELLDLVRIESLAEHLGEHYEVLARLQLAAGNRTAAVDYAQRALDELELFNAGGNHGQEALGGKDGKDTAGTEAIRELRAFLQGAKG